jgi:hypothetical protein
VQDVRARNLPGASAPENSFQLSPAPLYRKERKLFVVGPIRYLPGAFSNDPPVGLSYCSLLEDLARSEGDEYTPVVLELDSLQFWFLQNVLQCPEMGFACVYAEDFPKML